jgi:hypothetical protein
MEPVNVYHRVGTLAQSRRGGAGKGTGIPLKVSIECKLTGILEGSEIFLWFISGAVPSFDKSMKLIWLSGHIFTEHYFYICVTNDKNIWCNKWEK